jgi:hypothetical protein
MTLTLDLTPDIEQSLLAQAQAKGVSITEYVEQIIAQEVLQTAPVSSAPVSQARNLVELFANSPFKGLDIEFERDRDYGRDIQL